MIMCGHRAAGQKEDYQKEKNYQIIPLFSLLYIVYYVIIYKI